MSGADRTLPFEAGIDERTVEEARIELERARGGSADRGEVLAVWRVIRRRLSEIREI